MKDFKRLLVGVLVASILVPTYTITVGAADKTFTNSAESSIMPRFSIIDEYKATTKRKGNSIMISAELTACDVVDLSIDVTVKRDGKFDDSFSSSKHGSSLSLSETADYEPGHTYTVEFEFNAGGEIHTATKTVK